MAIDLELLPTQTQFIASKALYPAYIGGYGAGKTFINCVKAFLHSTVTNQGLRGLVVAPAYRDLRDVNIPEFIKLLDRFDIPYEWHKSNFNITLPWFKSTVMFRSADEPEKLKGPTVAWAGIDEVARIDGDIWGIIVSRVRDPESKHLQVFVTGTPEGYNWVYHKWRRDPKPNYQLFQAATDENTFLDSSYIDALNSSHDVTELKQKRAGEFAVSSKGRVYPAFDRNKHVFSTFLKDKSLNMPILTWENGRVDPLLRVIITCDFNIDPCIWLVLQHTGNMVAVLDEIVGHDVSTQDMVHKLSARFPKKRVLIFGDATGGYKRGTQAAKSDYAILRAAGFHNIQVPRRNPGVTDRVTSVNTMLCDGNNKVSLFVHERCARLIADLEGVKWKDGIRGTIDASNKELTHASDALGYFIYRRYGANRNFNTRKRVGNYLRK